MQQSKIDAVVNKIIDGIRDRERGFVLDLAGPDQREQLVDLRREVEDSGAGTVARGEALAIIDELLAVSGGTVIEVRETLPPVDEYQAPARYRQHKIGDRESFITYAKRYGSAERSLVMYGDEGCRLVIDELVERGERETAYLPFRCSDEWNAWGKLLNTPLDHRNFMRHIVAWEHTLADSDLLQAIRGLSFTATAQHDSTLNDDGSTWGVTFVTKGGESVKRFPKEFGLRLPVLEQDVGDIDTSVWHDVDVRLDLELPTTPGSGAIIRLGCSTWRQHQLDRVRAEGATIAEALDGWTVVHGEHHDEPRKLGNPRD